MRTFMFVVAAIAATGFSFTSVALSANDSVVARAKHAFTSGLALVDAEPSWLAQDAVYQYALSEPGLRGRDMNLRIEGRAAVLAHLRALAEHAPKATVSEVHVFPTLEPDIVFIQYKRTPVDGGNTTSPLAIVQMRGKEVVKYTQLGRAPETLQALKAMTLPAN